MNFKCSPPGHLSCFLNFANSNQVAEHVILVHALFVERVYLHSFKMYLQVECACLPLVNANVLHVPPKSWGSFGCTILEEKVTMVLNNHAFASIGIFKVCLIALSFNRGKSYISSSELIFGWVIKKISLMLVHVTLRYA